MIKWVSISALCFMGILVNAQDIHFSQFVYSPLNLNPALTGSFDGRYRIGFNHRQQWRSVSAPFQTTGIWADARNFLNVQGGNAGVNFFFDKAGTSEYNTLHLSVPLAFHYPVSKDSAHVLRIGLQPAFNFQSINPSALTTDGQWNGRRFDPNRSINENFDNTNFSYFDLALGLAYQYSAKGFQITGGAGVYNLFEPNTGFFSNDQGRVPRRWNFHVDARIDLSKEWFLTPALLYSTQANFSEFVIGTEINYAFNSAPYSYRAVFVGGWNRGSDAGIVNAGIYYNSWRVALSYDINYSSLNTASNYRGGWELSIIYILREILPKRENYKYCPNYL